MDSLFWNRSPLFYIVSNKTTIVAVKQSVPKSTCNYSVKNQTCAFFKKIKIPLYGLIILEWQIRNTLFSAIFLSLHVLLGGLDEPTEFFVFPPFLEV